MRKFRQAIMSFLLLLCCTSVLTAQSISKATKEDNIRKILTLTDASGIFKKTLESQINMLRKTKTEVPPKFWDEVLKEVDPDKFVELLVPIYDQHFSSDELEAIIVFYETPVGKKMISTLPQIMAESAAAGDKYGQQIATRVIQKMQAEGTFPSTAPSGDGKPVPPRR